MHQKRLLACCVVTLFWAAGLGAADSDLADAVMAGDRAAVRLLLQQEADVNAAQVDGTTALHWAVRRDDLEIAHLLIGAGADVSAANLAGATPMQLATINGNAAMIESLLEAGVDPNAALSQHGDTALMMAARTGRPDALQVLLDHGADIDARETWGGTTAVMWAVSEHHATAVRMLIDHGADVDARSRIYPLVGRGGSEGPEPEDAAPESAPIAYTNGGFTVLLFAAREGDLESARLLVAADANVNATASDGKDSLGLAIYNGNYKLASFLLDSGSNVDHPDAEGFTPLFWAVDRRNMEWNPGFPWTVTADPLSLIRTLLDAGADPNRFVDNTPRSRRNFGGSPRLKFATAVMRAAYSADLELVQLLLDYGADPDIFSSDNETPVLAAAGYGWIDGYSQGKSFPERLAVIQLLVGLGADVNWADDAGITPLMVAANMGDLPIIRYLVDEGANLGAHDLGKKNDGTFGGSIEPLMPIDYAIGVGTFRPNNAIVIMDDAVALMTAMMAERDITHTTSECTLRAFTCGDVDPMAATPAEIRKLRAIQIGHKVDGIVGGLAVEESLDSAVSDPTPRLPDGTPNLGRVPGEKGAWGVPWITNMAAKAIGQDGGSVVPSETPSGSRGPRGGAASEPHIPFLPWTAAVFDYNSANASKYDPEGYCLPPGGPRMMATPYPMEILQLPDQERIIMIFEGATHIWREIYMDGRPHPEGDALNPTFLGHSVGRWEGDTLVVDIVGFNENTWIDYYGHPHTDALHVVERFSRPNKDTLRYEATIDDPGAYSAPWTVAWEIGWRPDGELMEYICQENNRFLYRLTDDFGDPIFGNR